MEQVSKINNEFHNTCPNDYYDYQRINAVTMS